MDNSDNNGKENIQENDNKIQEETENNNIINTNEEKENGNEETNNTNTNQIIENGNQQIINEERFSNNQMVKTDRFEEEKNNEEEKTSEEEKQKIRKQKKIQQQLIKLANLKELNQKYTNLTNDIYKYWEKGRKEFESFYNAHVSLAIAGMFFQPCINANQDVINNVFKFLCNYFNFFKDKLKEILPKQILLINWIFNNNCNVFSKYPRINNNYNYNIFDENNDLISDKFFYFLLKEILPDAEIENSMLGENYNAMMKYFLEYLLKIGFIENYITDFLPRKDLDYFNYINFSYVVFYILNHCDKNFILKNDYNTKFISNFTDRMNYFLNDSQKLLKQNKEQYLNFLGFLIDNYNLIIFGCLAHVLENYEKNGMEGEVQNFLFSMYNYFEFLLKQQKLELRIFSLDKLVILANFYKCYNKDLKIYFNDTEKVFEYTQKIFLSFLVKINIFDLVFGENIHEALIERCYAILSFLYKNKSFPPEQISFLWKISQSKYQSINNSIITLFGKILPEFSNEDCNNILQTISNISVKDANETHLKLLENFFLSEHRHENLLNILYKYSNELGLCEGLSINIIKKSRNILIKLLFNQRYSSDLIQCIKNCLFCLDNNYLLYTYRQIFFEIMNEIIQVEKSGKKIEFFKLMNENIENFGLFVSYLDEKYSMYSILMNNLLFIKRFFIFFVDEALKLKEMSYQIKDFDINNELNIDKFFLKYQEYEKSNNQNIINYIEEGGNNEINNEEKIDTINYILPKSKKDIDNYILIIIKNFINFLKNYFSEENTDDIISSIFIKFEFFPDKITYEKILTDTLDSISSFHEFGNNYIKRDLLDFLFKLLIDNSLFYGEYIIFFNFIKNILSYQFNNYNLNLITKENIEYICLEKICSYSIKKLPYSAYECFFLYVINENEKNGNIVYSQVSNKFIEIKKINLLLGFKTILEFYIYNNSIDFGMNSLSTLTNIIEVSSCDKINRKYLLDELFSLLEKYKAKKKENIDSYESKIAFRKILRLISIINRTKVTKNLYDKNDPNNLLQLKINNHFFNNNDENKLTDFTAFKGLTVKEFKNELIDKIICKDDEAILYYSSPNPYQNISTLDQVKQDIKINNLLILYYKDTILKNDFTLADYNIKSEDTILILSSSVSQNDEFNMSQEQLKEGFEQIKTVFNDKYSEDIMKEALYNQRGDIQNTIIYLTDENNAVNLLKDIENKKKSKNDEPKKREEIISLEEDKFNVLLDILYEGDNDINDCISDLFSEIKFPDEFINNSIDNEFYKINEENNTNKKILILKIINNIIFDDNTFCKNNKLNKKIKNDWVSKFINNEIFVIQILKSLLEIKIEKNTEINNSVIIEIVINFFTKIFDKLDTKIKIKNGKEENNIDTNENEAKNINDIENKEELFGKFDIEEKDGYNFIEILSKNNFISLIYKVIKISLEFSRAQTKLRKKKIIKNIYDIIIEYTKIIPNDISQFLEEENKSKILLSILTKEPEIDIRKQSLDFIINLISVSKTEQNNKIDNNINIQSSLLDYYYENLISDEIYNEEFYELYNYLFNLDELKPNTLEIDKIIEKFLDNLYDFYVKNQNQNENNSFKEQIKNKLKYNLYILCSFSPLYNPLLKKEIDKKLSEQKDIISLLYDCLFKIEKDIDYGINYLFSDNQLRNNSLSLLSNLMTLDSNYFNILLQKVINHHKKIVQKQVELPLDYPLRKKSEKFLGLKNLGCTCYLNSLFQQMFMIPTFQRDILCFNIIDKKTSNENKLKESTIYNMQLSFVNLKKSIMSAYPPISFIRSFKKAFNGEPIKLGVQQDADEFLSILCDQLENEAKILGKENFLENSFKGKITNEIVSLENDCPYYSQTEEPFYRITLDIKGHKNLEDALNAYVKGEILDGENKYYVEEFKKKISIKKRVSLKKIGNQIIIHLKRFEFDFVTFQNNKLNDYLEFPLKLNLKKWTRAFIRLNEVEDKNENNITEEEKENLDDEKMSYELTGILVHSGSSLQSGHYYSFIKDQESDKWYKFNDSSISEYNIDKDLEKECFGNLDNKINQYGKGAYLLFYTKKECIEKNKNCCKEIIINEKILKEVEKENIEFLNIKTFVNENYHKFFMKFMKSSLNYFLKESNDSDKNDNKNEIKEKNYSLLLSDKMDKEIKIYDKISLEFNKNGQNFINEEGNEIKDFSDDVEDKYEKYKNELFEKDKKEIENINIENIVDLYFYYFFGLVIQFNDKEEKIKECSEFLLTEIVSKNNLFSLYIMKLIEENSELFGDLLFKYGFIDKDMTGNNLQLYNIYKTLFNSLYNFEKKIYGYISPELYNHFSKNEKGKLIIVKSHKSLLLRLFKNIFCENLEKCRKEYSRDSLFLNLFLLNTLANPETCLISSNYLISLISFITNNNLPQYKSKINPNFKMGNTSNSLYLTIFSEIILRCATPWMQKSKKETPYINLKYPENLQNLDIYLYPILPKDWEIMLTKVFFIDYFLSNLNNYAGKIVCHMCYEDEQNSIKILNLVNDMLKKKYYKYPDIEYICLNSFLVFEINDSFSQLRLETLFELEKEEDGLFDFYFDIRYKAPTNVLVGLFIISKGIEKYNNMLEYFRNNKNKVKWVNEYYIEFFMDTNGLNQNIGNIQNIHPDLFEIIETHFINKLEI